MTNLEIALKYMDILFASGVLDKLAGIFSEKLVFEGPFHRFDSASSYISSLKADPPIGFDYKLIRVFEAVDSVNLVYDFIKGDIRTPMSQLFEFEDEKISRILLIFDTAEFF